jgi:peptide-methionine (S)-S-oxide reductase
LEGGELKQAAFAAGCFWGVEYNLRRIDGVVETEVGYMGGRKESPTYEQVCTGKTGHAETVHLMYNPGVIKYDKLLDVFWDMHDPSTLNHQGSDVGTQYRSVIFYYDQEQEETARRSKARINESRILKEKVVTEILPASTFWRAEEYHQGYFDRIK